MLFPHLPNLRATLAQLKMPESILSIGDLSSQGIGAKTTTGRVMVDTTHEDSTLELEDKFGLFSLGEMDTIQDDEDENVDEQESQSSYSSKSKTKMNPPPCRPSLKPQKSRKDWILDMVVGSLRNVTHVMKDDDADKKKKKKKKKSRSTKKNKGSTKSKSEEIKQSRSTKKSDKGRKSANKINASSYKALSFKKSKTQQYEEERELRTFHKPRKVEVEDANPSTKRKIKKKSGHVQHGEPKTDIVSYIKKLSMESHHKNNKGGCNRQQLSLVKYKIADVDNKVEDGTATANNNNEQQLSIFKSTTKDDATITSTTAATTTKQIKNENGLDTSDKTDFTASSDLSIDLRSSYASRGACEQIDRINSILYSI